MEDPDVGTAGTAGAREAVPAAVDPQGVAGARRLNVALQGGGAHGAFTWGVLDRILEDGRVEIDSICGTSAGAMNAVVTAYGLSMGGETGAREKLHEFWDRISSAAKASPMQPTWLDRVFSKGNMDFSPMWAMFDGLTKVLSPYQLNPLNYNPLRDVLEAVVDFEALRRCNRVRLFLCATNVRSGRIRVFDTHEITADVVLASACLPFLFQAVEVDGEYFWDGGYMGNPPIYPLIYGSDCQDVLVIQINPINIPDVPRTSRDILDRINTLSFNSSLMREMRAIHFVTKLIDEGKLDPREYKRINIHTVHAEDEMASLGVSSKLNADHAFLHHLHELGRERAGQWIDANYDRIGRESSTDIAATLL